MLYDRNCEKAKIDMDLMIYVNHGDCGKIFTDGHIMLKKYYFETESRYRLKQSIFDTLKCIDNPHLVELYDVYSDMTLLTLFAYKMSISKFHIDAYTAKYYPNDSVNVLEMEIDYLIDNFKELEALFEIFTKHSIIVHDVKRENAILGKNSIVIIDPDCFNLTKLPEDVLKTHNKRELLTLFRDICLDCIVRKLDYKTFKMYYLDIVQKIAELSEIKIDENTEVVHELSKKLGSVRKPIDYFRR